MKSKDKSRSHVTKGHSKLGEVKKIIKKSLHFNSWICALSVVQIQASYMEDHIWAHITLKHPELLNQIKSKHPEDSFMHFR